MDILLIVTGIAIVFVPWYLKEEGIVQGEILIPTWVIAAEAAIWTKHFVRGTDLGPIAITGTISIGLILYFFWRYLKSYRKLEQRKGQLAKALALFLTVAVTATGVSYGYFLERNKEIGYSGPSIKELVDYTIPDGYTEAGVYEYDEEGNLRETEIAVNLHIATIN